MGKMRFIEIAVWVLFLIGTILKFTMHSPELDQYYYLICAIPTVFYFVGSILLFRNKALEEKQMLISFLSGLFFALVFLGAGLKWSFAGKGDYFLFFGNLSIFLWLIPLCWWNRNNLKIVGLRKSFYNRILLRSVFIGLFGWLVLLTPIEEVKELEYGQLEEGETLSVPFQLVDLPLLV